MLRIVGNYMREMGIRAQYIKPYTITTNSDFDSKLENILMNNLILQNQIVYRYQI